MRFLPNGNERKHARQVLLGHELTDWANVQWRGRELP